MHLQTKDLPKLFTDTDNDPLDGGDKKLSKFTFEGTLNSCDDEISENHTSRDSSSPDQNDLIRNGLIDNITVDNSRDRESAEVKAIVKLAKEEEESSKRQWLLQQYQYEDHEDEEVLQVLEKPGNRSKNPTESIDEEKSIGEVRLEKLETQIKEDRASLTDNVANYMRSKYELSDMKKNLRKIEQQAKGLRAKIAKLKAKEMEEADIKEDCAKIEEQNEKEDYNGGMCSLFDNDVAPARSKQEAIVITNVYVPDLLADIPSDWTGKRPKDLFLEQCRKKKIPKPIFSKIPATKNGCTIKLKMKGGAENVIQHEGPFSSFKDAEHFVSTKALYELDPNIPLYRLLPPLFRDLWKGWIDAKEADKGASDAKKEDEKQDEIQSLIRAIHDALPAQNESTVMSEYRTKESEGSKELDDWDDESWESNNDQNEEQNTYIEDGISADKLTPLGKRMRNDFKKKDLSSRYQKMKQIRASLPMYVYREKLLQTMEKNKVIVLCAETGDGKTTQCSQYILEDAFERGYGDKVSIICTQPRRISALSVAERVAEEMDERIGKHVGYQIRMEAKRSKDTKLMFCTTGVVLRRLQDDPDLKGITHVIVDECHERQWQIDFLLIALRRLLQTTRKDLKVILMSATLDSELFCSFFNGAPFFSIPGRTYPVNQYYLEDILETSGYIVEEDSRYAMRRTREDNTASLWVTGRGGEKKRTMVSLESELESLEVSELYDGYSMSTRR
jgi:ATP-dependent RNA helicase DHX29